jgi:hypothetical protein
VHPLHAPGHGFRIDELYRTLQQLRLRGVKWMMLSLGSVRASAAVSAR